MNKKEAICVTKLRKSPLFLLLGIPLAGGVLRPLTASRQVWRGSFPAGAGGWFRANLGDQIIRLLPAP